MGRAPSEWCPDTDQKEAQAPVEVVPVPDEQAINRAAIALRDLLGMQTLAPDLVRAVLAAALDQPNGS